MPSITGKRFLCMRNAIIIHGAYGYPEENWFPWLKKELKQIGFKVFVPQFPTPNNQNLKNWNKVFLRYEKYVDEDTILIGHSLGALFIMNILENYKVKACYLVGGFLGLLGVKKFDIINKTITNRKFNFKKIKKNCKIFFVYNSDNDLMCHWKKEKSWPKN